MEDIEDNLLAILYFVFSEGLGTTPALNWNYWDTPKTKNEECRVSIIIFK